MKFIIPGPLKQNIYTLMRDFGYHFQREDSEREATEYSFVRPRVGFPRFHIYAKMDGINLACNLHLDQKKPLYQGSTAHSGDYNEPAVEAEAKRIKNAIDNPLY
jgi:hypothetical protein